MTTCNIFLEKEKLTAAVDINMLEVSTQYQYARGGR
jgi:hypothetical protein